MKLGSCSIGINPFWLVGIVGVFHALSEEKQFSVGSIDQPASNQVDTVEKHWQRLVSGATGLQPKTIEKVFS